MQRPERWPAYFYAVVQFVDENDMMFFTIDDRIAGALECSKRDVNFAKASSFEDQSVLAQQGLEPFSSAFMGLTIVRLASDASITLSKSIAHEVKPKSHIDC